MNTSITENMVSQWLDASIHTPNENAPLILTVESLPNGNRHGGTAEVTPGLYCDGEFFIGSTTVGDPLDEDQVVTYFSYIRELPNCYDNSLCRKGDGPYRLFKLANNFEYYARQCVDGVLIDPRLPPRFDSTPNEDRPQDHEKFWQVPFIKTKDVSALDALYQAGTGEHAEKARKEWEEKGRAHWLQAWPSGIRYETRCLDGGAWDRSTSLGMYATLEEAVQRAKVGGTDYHLSELSTTSLEP
jgi:hypothetical protein